MTTFLRLNRLTALLLLCSSVHLLPAQDTSRTNPSFEQIMSLHSVFSPEISPDGRHVLFQKQTVDWENNQFDREIWLSKDGEDAYPLTNDVAGSSRSPQWSPDGHWIAYLAKGKEHIQVFVTRLTGGAAFQVTNTNQNINQFQWAPNGQQIAFIQRAEEKKEDKKIEELYGSFEVEDEKFSFSELWTAPFKSELMGHTPLPDQLKDSAYMANFEAKPLMDSFPFTVSNFKWSPDGSKIAIEHRPDPLINSFFKSDISMFDVATGDLTLLVQNPSFDGIEDWSPDSKELIYGSHLDDTTSNYYLNSKLFKINLVTKQITQLGSDFDEDLFNIQWTKSGIYAVAYQKTSRHLLKINEDTGQTSIVPMGPERFGGYTISDDGKKMAFSGSDNHNLTELFIHNFEAGTTHQITNTTSQIENWNVADSEVISWPSKDGTIIEGVLHKPMDYDPEKAYPLLVVIHGGPTGISTPTPTPSYVYPIVQWLNKGALVLRPNYRGSAGYGEAFRSLNVQNLGVGDAWDVLSGVEYLEHSGIIDGSKVGAMGWSQGGYISAFLTTNSNKFKAISVGAGISNWMTYYVNTDIHPFTRQYLKATPWSDKAIYEKTSPMTNINQATTPTLIQHGEFDRRVPIANAYELFQGLQDVGVPTKLIVYKGFGHGITKPKERLAAVWHNWQWFGKYMWDEEIEIPVDD